MTALISGSLVLTGVMAAAAEPLGSTPKSLSTNFTLVNLEAGANNGSINYYKDDGSPWRTAESFNFTTEGDQLIKRQYDASSGLSTGSGSVVVSAAGKLGAVVQIQARGQTPTSGAYSGATAGAASANVPLVLRNLTGASGVSNSQIYVQNTGTGPTNIEIDLISPNGTLQYKKTHANLAVGTAYNYDLADESPSNVPNGWFGSAVVKATSANGGVTVVSNLFSGANGMQTFNAFINKGQVWLAPLFTSRLTNGLSTPIAVQNLSGQEIPVGGIKLICKKDPGSGGADFNTDNKTAVGNTASYFFNPVTDSTNLPTNWFGACRIETTGFDTVVFVQMRTIGTDLAASYEGIKGDGTAKKVVIPLYGKRLTNGFATAITIQNLSNTAAANVTLAYKGSAGLPANCTINKTASIPAGGSLIQNLRLDQTGAGAVPELGNNCFGTLVVTSADQAIDAFVQLSDVSGQPGDTLQAHNAFTVQ
jgi:hypothetical protein